MIHRVNRTQDQFGVRFYGEHRQARFVIPLHAVPPGTRTAKASVIPGGVLIHVGNSLGSALRQCGGLYLMNVPSDILKLLDVPHGSTAICGSKMWGNRWFLPIGMKKGA